MPHNLLLSLGFSAENELNLGDPTRELGRGEKGFSARRRSLGGLDSC
jgi:hypothetical protein